MIPTFLSVPRAATQPVAITLCATSVGIYIFLGGARASVWTDALQGLIALLVLSISALLFSIWIGGIWEGVATLYQVMPEKLVFNRDNTPIFIDNVLSWTFAFFLWPHIFQRMFMSQSPQVVRKTAAILAIVFPVLLTFLMIMAIAATAELYGNLEDPDQLIATMFHRHFPIGGVILSILVFALAMSTIDSMLLALGSSASRDVWRGLLRREGLSEAGFTRGRWLTLIFLILATVFALTAIGRGAITPWVTLGASIASLCLWPFIGVFVWKRAAAGSVIAAMCLGFVAICITRFTSLGELLPVGFATAGFLVAAVTFLLAELLTPRQFSQDES